MQTVDSSKYITSTLYFCGGIVLEIISLMSDNFIHQCFKNMFLSLDVKATKTLIQIE